MRFFLSSGGAGPRAGFGAGGLDASRGLIADAFAPVLARLGEVVPVDTPAEGVRLARDAAASEASGGALHLCVALPHELPPEAGAETVAAFGLSLATCPETPFAGDPRTDWRLRLGCSGGALVFSTHAAAAVRALMGDICPVLTAPPPVACAQEPAPPAPATLRVTGAVLDTADWPKTAPPDRATWLAGEAALLAESDGSPQVLEANPPPSKTLRYRLGVTRLHLAYLYREVVRDVLPRPVARAVSRAGGLGVRVARRLVVGREQAPASLPPADLDFPPPPTGEEAALWRPGTSAVTLDGFVCAAVHGGWDRSWGELLSAWVEVCRDDASATLAVKTAGLDQDTRNSLAGTLRRLGPFACRVVILDGAIEGGLDALIGCSAFYLCASPSEAAPLPLQRFLAAGRPAVSPSHSALADLIDADTSFVVASGLEYESWPGDVEERLAATGWRLDWELLCAGIASARALWHQPEAYAGRARAVARRTSDICGPDVVLSALRNLGAPRPAPLARRPAGRPVILVHSETDAGTLATRLGTAEYSYFFVLRFFRPVLERIGRVVPVADPAREVDRLYAQATARGEPCVFLSFSPPHRTPTGFACPTVPVFAWEFDTIPQEHWGGERRHDWARVLRTLGCAIVHSQATVQTVRGVLGEEFPVWSIPAPVWDCFAPATPHARPARSQDIHSRHRARYLVDGHGQPAPRRKLVRARARRTRAARPDLRGQAGRGGLQLGVQPGGRPEELDRHAGRFLPRVPGPAERNPGAETDASRRHLGHGADAQTYAPVDAVQLPRRADARLSAGRRLCAVHVGNDVRGEHLAWRGPVPAADGGDVRRQACRGTAAYGYGGLSGRGLRFLVRSSAEPGSWPQDTRLRGAHASPPDRPLNRWRRRFEKATTSRQERPDRYAAMGAAAIERLRRHCSLQVTEERLRAVFKSLLGADVAANEQDQDAPEDDRGIASDVRLPRGFEAQLAERISKLGHYQTVRPPNLADYHMFDPAEPNDVELLSVNYGFEVQSASGNAIFVHRAAKKALSKTPIRIGGFCNAVLIDADCTMHGSIDMTGDFNLAVFEGGQSYLAIGATFYGGDTLVWGHGASSWGLRVWVQGGVTCTIGEGCLFSENITIRCTDHHSIFDLDTGDQINKPARRHNRPARMGGPGLCNRERRHDRGRGDHWGALTRCRSCWPGRAMGGVSGPQAERAGFMDTAASRSRPGRTGCGPCFPLKRHFWRRTARSLRFGISHEPARIATPLVNVSVQTLGAVPDVITSFVITKSANPSMLNVPLHVAPVTPPRKPLLNTNAVPLVALGGW